MLVSGEGDSPGNFWPCSDHVWVWKISRAGLRHWEAGVLPSFMGKQPLTSICTALLAGLQDTVLSEPWRTLLSCLGSLKDSSWPWKSQEWGMPRAAGYSVSSGVRRCFCTTKPALMQCFCQVSCCRVSAITCCFLLLIFVSPNHYTPLPFFPPLVLFLNALRAEVRMPNLWMSWWWAVRGIFIPVGWWGRGETALAGETQEAES